MPRPSTAFAPNTIDTSPIGVPDTPRSIWTNLIGIGWAGMAGLQLISILFSVPMVSEHNFLLAILIFNFALEAFMLMAGIWLLQGRERGRRIIRFVLGLQLVGGVLGGIAAAFILVGTPAGAISAGFMLLFGAIWIAVFGVVYLAFRHLGAPETLLEFSA